MLVFHFHINGVDHIPLRHFYAVRILVNHVPASLRHLTSRKIGKYILVEIPDIIVVRFVPLAENLIIYNFLPADPVNRFIKNQFDRVDQVAVKSF